MVYKHASVAATSGLVSFAGLNVVTSVGLTDLTEFLVVLTPFVISITAFLRSANNHRRLRLQERILNNEKD